ncbi:MAG: DUF5993 family protein [Campylobacterota bacterium]|nr:DUF5993 family protein [Campylobacterota bacterium]
MDSLLFTLLLVAFVATFFNFKRVAISSFVVTMLLYMYWFSYHATETLDINL